MRSTDPGNIGSLNQAGAAYESLYSLKSLAEKESHSSNIYKYIYMYTYIYIYNNNNKHK